MSDCNWHEPRRNKSHTLSRAVSELQPWTFRIYCPISVICGIRNFLIILASIDEFHGDRHRKGYTFLTGVMKLLWRQNREAVQCWVKYRTIWNKAWTLWRNAALPVSLQYSMFILQCSCVCVYVCVCVRARAILIWVHVFPISLLATFRCLRKKLILLELFEEQSYTYLLPTRVSSLRHFFTTRNYLTDFESGRETKSRRESEFT